MIRFNKFDSNVNPKWEPDALVQFELFATEKSGRKREVVNGYRPQYKVRRDYLTSTFHFFLIKNQ